MRAVRCDVCGAKAMTAAAQCPTCGHAFELRDGFGELVPLAYCSSCKSYYPESVGECRWCHTKPERPPIGPQIWRGVGIAAVVASVGVGYLLRDDNPPDIARQRAKTAAQTPPLPLPADTALATVAMSETKGSPAPIATTDSIARDSIAPTASVDVATTVAPTATTVAPTPAPPQIAPIAAPRPAMQPAPSSVAAKPVRESAGRVATATTTPKAKAKRSTQWVSSISRDWVPVRAGASKRSRLVASIGPNSRVQLGESRDGWRRIRAKGVAGWVEQHVEFRVATNR